jgi:hypothetical protein
VVGRIYLDKHEVTVAAYAECVSAGLCQPMRKDNPFCNTLFADRQKHPVNCIDWNDAAAHCNATYIREIHFAGRRSAVAHRIKNQKALALATIDCWRRLCRQPL